MEEGRADVQAPPPPSRERGGRAEVDGDSDESRGEHEAAPHLRRVDEAAHGGVDDPHADERERDSVGLGGEHLEPREPERPPATRGTAGERGGQERQRERGGIREHVARVGE